MCRVFLLGGGIGKREEGMGKDGSLETRVAEESKERWHRASF